MTCQAGTDSNALPTCSSIMSKQDFGLSQVLRRTSGSYIMHPWQLRSNQHAVYAREHGVMDDNNGTDWHHTSLTCGHDKGHRSRPSNECRMTEAHKHPAKRNSGR
ncbi:hypothetical protein ABBQ32_006910 [Trebouxia sp. C0010 RCD-2024]